jgi:hypothetical protein
VSASSLHGPAALVGMGIHGEPSAPGLEPVPHAIKTANFPPTTRWPCRGASGGADGASCVPRSLAQGRPEEVWPLQ